MTHPIIEKLVNADGAFLNSKEWRGLIDQLNDLVDPLCKTDTHNSESLDENTRLWDWLYEGDYSGSETPESLAAEWDELSEAE